MFSSDLLLLLLFGQQPKQIDHCEVSSALHPEQNQRQLHGMFMQQLQLLKISSCGIRNQGFTRARIWWKSEHKTHTQVKAYSSPSFF
jgi:hypothetical protein